MLMIHINEQGGFELHSYDEKMDSTIYHHLHVKPFNACSIHHRGNL